MAKVPIDIPLVDAATLEAFGVTQQDFVDDICYFVRILSAKLAMEFKDALFRDLRDRADGEQLEGVPDSILTEDTRTAFKDLDDAMARVAHICTDEARRQRKARRRKRDRDDRVLSAILERERQRGG